MKINLFLRIVNAFVLLVVAYTAFGFLMKKVDMLIFPTLAIFMVSVGVAMSNKFAIYAAIIYSISLISSSAFRNDTFLIVYLILLVHHIMKEKKSRTTSKLDI